MTSKTALLIGLDPNVVDFSATPGLDATKLAAGLKADQERARASGYDLDLCLTDTGETAEQVITTTLKAKQYDCIVIGAGVRTLSTHFMLFERIINIVHVHAVNSKIAFNTKPTDTVEAIVRWA